MADERLTCPPCYGCRSKMIRIKEEDVFVKNEHGEFWWEKYRCPKCGEVGGPTYEKRSGEWVRTGEAY